MPSRHKLYSLRRRNMTPSTEQTTAEQAPPATKPAVTPVPPPPMADLTALTAKVAHLEGKFNTFVAATAPSNQKVVDELSARIDALAEKIDKATPKAV